MIPPVNFLELFVVFCCLVEFGGIYFYEDNEVAENEWPEYETHKPKKPQAHNNSKNGDERVYIANLFH